MREREKKRENSSKGERERAKERREMAGKREEDRSDFCVHEDTCVRVCV